jgi:hypothetical protein
VQNAKQNVHDTSKNNATERCAINGEESILGATVKFFIFVTDMSGTLNDNIGKAV